MLPSSLSLSWAGRITHLGRIENEASVKEVSAFDAEEGGEERPRSAGMGTREVAWVISQFARVAIGLSRPIVLLQPITDVQNVRAT